MSRASENAYARKYYKTHSTYRKKKIEDRKDYASSHKKEEASQSRKYYHENPDYKRYKIRYAKAYQKTHRTKKNK